MERQMHTRTFPRFLRIGAAALILLLAACAPQPTVAPTSAPAPAITGAPPPTFTPPGPDSTPAPMAADGQTAPLSADGPWLLVNTGHGLWAANADGSGGALLTAGRVLIPGGLSNAVSYGGGYAAYLTTTDYSIAYGNYPNLTLHVMALPGGEAVAALPLTSPDTEPGAQNPSDILRAMVEHTSFAWSPDGKRLAFIGAVQGPSADLYEYLPADGALLRLTDGKDQAYSPIWSPDGEWIAQTAAAGFGTGAGIPVTGFYAARADGTGVTSLYPIPQNSGGEYGIGWLNGTTMVTHSWFMTCGPSDLRLANLSGPQADLVFEGCLSGAAVAPKWGRVLVAQSPETAMFDADPQPGLFLITNALRTPQLISDADIREIVWAEGRSSFLARSSTNQLYEISPMDGDLTVLADEEPRIPTVSPDGKYWAMFDSSYPNSVSGVWVGEYGQKPRQIFSEAILLDQLIFSPAGDALYFLDAAGSLYRAQAPDWVPALVAADLKPADSGLAMGWAVK